MGKVTYRDGIAIAQLVVFPIFLVADLFIWKRSGWRVGSKIWRFAVILCLLRIAGSIASLISIDHDSKNVEIAVLVCELIGIAPLTLTWLGLLRQIDYQQILPPNPLKVIDMACLIALILAIVGVNDSDMGAGYTTNKLLKVAVAIFLVAFAVILLLSLWLFVQLKGTLLNYQKKLFLAIALSAPIYTVRLIDAAIGDFSTIAKFSVEGNTTIYLCMSVLEEIVAMAIVSVLGIMAVREEDFVKLSPKHKHLEAEMQQPHNGY